MKHRLIALLTIATATAVQAQEERSSSSLYLNPLLKADVSMPFNISGEGKRYAPTWGLDQAWINEQNLRKGLNHMGQENIGIGRTAFRTTDEPNSDGTLADGVVNHMRQRSNLFNIVSKTLPLVFTADQEAGSASYYVTNKVANVARWAANINTHVKWMQDNTQHPIVGVSPFNEPDYWTTEEGASESRHRDVAKTLKEQYPAFSDGIAIVGGNTLNNDKAWSWFQAGQQYYDWGNTHQLAGSFDNYANYYRNLTNAGKVGYNDEMHNVAEAMIGLENGMTIGIWWGFDSRARGEFCEISRHGERIAYTDHRTNWTAASVYRHDDGRVKAFIGSSERQALTTTYQLVSADRDVYYDGYGPVREFRMEIPGGTGYQTGQTNAERVIDITWGEEVPPYPITDGIYKLVNKQTGRVLAYTGSGSNVAQQNYSGTAKQKWNIKPCDPRVGGDYSFFDIAASDNAKIHINVRNFSTAANADIIAWAQDSPSSNEQWYLEYAGDGYYYIRNRESALYLSLAGTSTLAKITQAALRTDNPALQQWRILPADINYETTAPAQPTGLTAQPQPASVRLTWTANGDSDLEAYEVVRAVKGTDDWNTIARSLTQSYFVDNTCRPGTIYIYKVKAIDHALNHSEASQTVEAGPAGEKTMIARWEMEGNLYDTTVNMMDAASASDPLWRTADSDHKQGAQALYLNNLTSAAFNYVQLPYEVASSDELTVAMWVNWRGSGNWQRLFDFGTDTDHYLFLTPNNGSNKMRFAIKNGGEEQQLDTPAKLDNLKWHHVAVSIGNGRTAIIVDGDEVASTTAITIRPSDIRPVLNYIGRSQFTADPLFTGYIDDVRIYNYALSADEVKTAMADTESGINDVPSATTTAATVYDLNGRQLPTTQQGINIIEGKKVIKR